jgi:hypothetical protein
MREHSAADASARFQHSDFATGTTEFARRGQTGSPCTNDENRLIHHDRLVMRKFSGRNG